MERRTVIMRGAALSLAFALLVACVDDARAGETDQYLVWGVELPDSSETINRYLNDEIERYIDKRNHEDKQPCDDEELTRGIYVHFFKGLYASRLRDFLQNSPEVERYPEPSVSYFEYQRLSIYRDHSFPYILPLARTIRVGDVYCGIDKFSHFFGFGRRHYNRYLRLLALGKSEQEAMEGVVLAGIAQESSLVGMLVDGCFSHADLEASFQGFLMARDLCGGEDPFLVVEGNAWKLVRPIDIRAYVTPYFDESYNPNHYWALRKRFVLPLLKEEYSSEFLSQDVQRRFDVYHRWEPSFSRRTIHAYFDAKDLHPQQSQFVEAFGVPPPCVALSMRVQQADRVP